MIIVDKFDNKRQLLIHRDPLTGNHGWDFQETVEKIKDGFRWKSDNSRGVVRDPLRRVSWGDARLTLDIGEGFEVDTVGSRRARELYCSIGETGLPMVRIFCLTERKSLGGVVDENCQLLGEFGKSLYELTRMHEGVVRAGDERRREDDPRMVQVNELRRRGLDQRSDEVYQMIRADGFNTYDRVVRGSPIATASEGFRTKLGLLNKKIQKQIDMENRGKDLMEQKQTAYYWATWIAVLAMEWADLNKAAINCPMLREDGLSWRDHQVFMPRRRTE
jgi:hypothetical protein